MIGAVLAVALGVLGADGADGVDARPEIVLWHSYRGTEQDALEHLVQDHNAVETRYRVTVLAVPYDAYLDKITAAIPRGRGPDVFIAAHDTIGDWAEAKVIAPVDELLDAQTASTLEPGLVDAVLYKGHAWAYPLAFKSLVLFRNTALVPEAPRTLAALEESARALTKDGSYGLVYENRQLYFHAPLLFGYGARIFDDAGRPTLDSPAAIASVHRAMALAPLMPQEVNGALATSLFNDGKAAFFFAGPWSLGDIDPKIPLATSALPLIDDTRAMTPFLSVEGAFLSGKTAPEKKPFAEALVRWLASDDVAVVRLNVGLQPVAQKAAWASLAIGPDANPRASLLRGFLDQQKHALPTPNTPEMKSVWSQFDLALGASIGQGTPPEQTLVEAQKKTTELVATIESGVHEGNRTSFAWFIGVVIALVFALVVVGVARYGPKRLVVDAWKNRGAYAYTAPAAVGMIALVFVPFAFGVGMGFFEHSWGKYTFVGLDNFGKILGDTDGKFFHTLWMTVLWTTANVFLHLVIGVFLALVLSQARLRFRALYRVLFVIPWAVPNYITALIWKGMFHPELGAINHLLHIEGFSWMNATWSAFTANVVTNTWLGFPFMMVIALGGLTAIPKDLYEAAALDGAGPLRRFFSITLPLLMPTLAPAIVLGTVWTFNMFNVIYLVSGGAPNNETDILITEAFRWAFERGQGGAFGYAAAYSTLVFLLLVAYTTAANRVARAVSEARA